MLAGARSTARPRQRTRSEAILWHSLDMWQGHKIASLEWQASPRAWESAPTSSEAARPRFADNIITNLTVQRAVKADEVRRLRTPCGDHAWPLPLHFRAALPFGALLTTRRALVLQESKPELAHAADPQEHLLGRLAVRRPSSPTWSCSAERRQLHRRLPWAGERHSHLARRQRLGGGPRLNLAAAPSS